VYEATAVIPIQASKRQIVGDERSVGEPILGEARQDAPPDLYGCVRIAPPSLNLANGDLHM